jgi:hypothetical protein
VIFYATSGAAQQVVKVVQLCLLRSGYSDSVGLLAGRVLLLMSFELQVTPKHCGPNHGLCAEHDSPCAVSVTMLL